jgi:hypothetical protein
MPVKFKSSEVVVNRQTKKKTIKNYYMHAQSTPLLQKALADDNTRGPRKQKIRNELVRRGESLVPSEELA